MKIRVPSLARSSVLVPFLALPLVLGACGEPRTEAAQVEKDAAERAEASSPDDRRLPVRVVELRPEDVVDRVEYSADLEPLRHATIAAEIGGPVRRIHAEAGETVRRGDVLLEVDTAALERELEEAEAVHRQRRAQFERAEALLERRSITRQQFLDAVTNRDVAAARLATAELRLERARPMAPWSGEIAARHVEEGDYVRPGEPLFDLLDVSRLEVRADAPASDVPHLRVGLPVEVRVDVFPGRAFHGELVRLGSALDRGARTLELVAEIDPAGTALRPGLAARLALPRRTLDDVLLVPLEALVKMGDADHAGDAVYVVDELVDGEGRAARRSVRLGSLIGRRVVVEEGLAAGDFLIVEGEERVSPGQVVEVRDEGIAP